MIHRVHELLLSDGTSPYADWFHALDAQAAAKASVAKLRMERGSLSNIEWFSGIGEYKIDWGPGYRIYLARDGKDLLVLLGGGTKRRQQKDIDWALELWSEYKQRKAAAKKPEK